MQATFNKKQIKQNPKTRKQLISQKRKDDLQIYKHSSFQEAILNEKEKYHFMNLKNSFRVKAILDRRTVKRSKNESHPEYLIHWEGWNVKESTWEPLRNLKYVLEMVKQFDKEYDSSSRAQIKMQQKEASDAPTDVTSYDEPQIPKKQNFKKKIIKKEIQQSKSEGKIKQQHFDKQTARNFQNFNSEAAQVTSSNVSGQRQQLKVLGMCCDFKDQWLFHIQRNELQSYFTRDDVIKEDPEALIRFYESKIIFRLPNNQL